MRAIVTPTDIQSLPQFKRLKQNFHGGYFVLMSGAVLMVVPVGTWSAECTQSYIRDISDIYLASGVGQFGTVVCFDGWQLGTPDAIEMIREFNEHAHESGMIAESFVDYPHSAPINFAKHRIAYAFSPLHSTSCFDEALQQMALAELDHDADLLTSAYNHRHELLR